jgi:DNA-binding CsgD family transcriptional regulator
LPVGFAFYDDQFVLQKNNRKYADYVRMYTPFHIEQALGMSHFDYKPGAAPYMEGWFISIRNSKQPDTRYNLELRVTIDQKECISFWDSHLEPIIDAFGRLQGFLMCRIDRTERNLFIRSRPTESLSAHLLAHKCEDLKTTLRVLMSTQEEDRRLTESKFMLNLLNQIMPILKRLKKTELSKQQKLLVEVIKKQLNSIVSPFTMKLSSEHFGLTPTEIRVAGLIAKGLTSKEIADVTYVSKECIDFHRHNIRKKIGIVGKKVNLQAYLSSIFSVP